MKRFFWTVLLSAAFAAAPLLQAEEGFTSLFDGKSFDGWKLNENKDTFSIVDGAIVAKGPRSHLYYAGDVNGAVFKNFEFKIDVKTTPGSNGGIYFHTAYQATGWPDKGFEVQVNSSHKDRRKTGGLYGVADVMDNPPAPDGEWYTQHIIVEGDKVTIKVNGKVATEWMQPADWNGLQPADGKGPKFPGRKLDEGTFALQGHDPGSIVGYKNIRVKALP